MRFIKLQPFLIDEIIHPSDHVVTACAPRLFTSLKQTQQVVNDNKEFRISVDVPGVKKADMDIKVDEGVVHVSGFRRIIASDGKSVKKARFARSFSLNDSVDVDKYQANLSDGVLLISAPKKPLPQAKTIAITTHPHPDPTPIETEPNACAEDNEKR